MPGNSNIQADAVTMPRRRLHPAFRRRSSWEWTRWLWILPWWTTAALLAGLLLVSSLIALPVVHATSGDRSGRAERTTAEGRSRSLHELAIDDAVSGSRSLRVPVVGVTRETLRPSFHDPRGSDRRHEAIDIPAPRGTPVVAATDGRIERLARSGLGGITLDLLAVDGDYSLYYAHLDGYARGLAEGRTVEAGEVIGFVGSTGNAPRDVPHLHFALHRRGMDGAAAKERPVDPYPWLLLGRLPPVGG